MKFLKFIETRRCLSVPSITNGMASNVVEVPICFRNVTSKKLQPCRIVFILGEAVQLYYRLL